MKKVLITGGNGDISKSIVNLLSKDSNYLIFSPVKEVLDVTDLNSVKDYFRDKIFDIVINNAGYILPNSIQKSDYQNYFKTININLVGSFLIANKALEINPDCYIINIGSSAASKSHANWSAYCASKAGIVMATTCWHLEGVKTICLSPGRTATKMRKSLFKRENPETLLDPDDFAKVVIKAINQEYSLGVNLDVNTNNVGGLLK